MSVTLKQIRDQVKQDLDLEEETFIEDSDIDRWINDAVRTAEAQIHTLYEDYFLVEQVTPIVSGSSLIDYPTDIYANKIRKIIFNEGGAENRSHEVKRVANLIQGKELDFYGTDTTQPILRWSPSNDATVGRKIRLFPSTGRTGNLHIWYVRNAKTLVLDADVCDIDEFERYIVQYTKTQAYLKDGDPRANDSRSDEEQFKADMVNTLSNLAPDDNDEIPVDVGFYDDMVGGEY